MRRFLHSLIRHFYLVLAVIVVANIPTVNGLVRSATQKFLQIQTVRGFMGGLGQYFAMHPNTIVPISVSVILFGIMLYCLYDSHFSGRPLLRVQGMPWRGPFYLAGKDNKPTFGQYAYVSIVNRSEGITDAAIARNLMVKVQLLGKKLRSHSETRVPWVFKDGKPFADRGELQPEDALHVPVAIQNNHQNKMMSFTPSTYESYTMQDPYGTSLNEPLYLVKITLRGIGVYQVLWFALQDFVVNPNILGIYELGFLERMWVQLNLRGIGPSWEEYWQHQQQKFNARNGSQIKFPRLSSDDNNNLEKRKTDS